MVEQKAVKTMRVDGISKVNQVYQANMVNRVTRKENKYGTDALELSSQAKDTQLVKKALNSSSDIRVDKVEEIKKKMQQGTYQVSNKDLADKMVESFFDARV